MNVTYIIEMCVFIVVINNFITFLMVDKVMHLNQHRYLFRPIKTALILSPNKKHSHLASKLYILLQDEKKYRTLDFIQPN